MSLDRPITDFMTDINIKFIMQCWLGVRSEAADLKDWEPALVVDVIIMFG